jgi:hypothetical protein
MIAAAVAAAEIAVLGGLVVSPRGAARRGP